MSAKKNTHRSTAAVPIVFLHGFSGDSNGLRKFADLYAGEAAICINMPGFGGAPVSRAGQSRDIRSYCNDVWAEIRKIVPKGPVTLVGHSHGAMIGYVLAVQHPNDIVRLDLFCPVARPRLVPRLSISLIRFMRFSGMPSGTIVRAVSHPVAVALATRYSFRPYWSADDRRRITEMRRREAQFYSPAMFDIMHQTLQFTEVMQGSYCTVPTRLYYVPDENIAGGNDYKWYEKHAAIDTVKQISGGHLCVTVNPARVVELVRLED